MVDGFDDVFRVYEIRIFLLFGINLEDSAPMSPPEDVSMNLAPIPYVRRSSTV